MELAPKLRVFSMMPSFLRHLSHKNSNHNVSKLMGMVFYSQTGHCLCFLSSIILCVLNSLSVGRKFQLNLKKAAYIFGFSDIWLNLGDI